MLQSLSRVTFLLMLICTLVCASATSAARAADRLYLTIDPPEKDSWEALFLRELPRQTLIVAIGQELPVAIADVAAEPQIAEQAGDLKLGLVYRFESQDQTVGLRLIGSDGNDISRIEVAGKGFGWRIAPYEQYVAGAYDPIRDQWVPLVAELMGVERKAPQWDPTLEAPDGSDDLLLTIDFHHAFLAARATHAAISDTGESPQRLAVLVRAYANLGESTRHVISAQSTAFFARSLAYSERLIRQAPDDPMSWWARAYAYTLFGLPQPARESLAKADDLTEEDRAGQPRWVKLVRGLAAVRTAELFDEIGHDKASDPMASYFAWLTVEHAPLPSLVINFGQIALDRNPGALRVLDSISENSGVSMLHRTTLQAPRQLNRLIASLADEPAADAVVRAAARKAVQEGFSVPALMNLLTTLENQPAEQGQLLPWRAYSAIVRECLYVNALRRLYFVKHQWSVDPTDDHSSWHPTVAGHRYASVFDTFGRKSAHQAAAEMKDEKWLDFQQSGALIAKVMRAGNVNEVPGRGMDWYHVGDDQADFTVFSVARNIWMWRHATANTGALRMHDVNALLKADPDHPLGLAYAMYDSVQRPAERSEELLPPKEQIEQMHGDNPIVAYGLGIAYLAERRPEDALRNLKRATRMVVDRPIYERMAEAYLELGDEEGWLANWDEYLESSEDYALNHASVGRIVAERLIAQGKPEQALPYSELAADSYSGWGLTVYAENLVALKRYDEAAKVIEAQAERYGNWLYFHRWVHTIGRGDRERARQAAQRRIDSQRVNNPNYLTDIGLFHQLEGKLDQALAMYSQASQESDIALASSLAALVALDLEKSDDEISRLLKEGESKATRTPRERAYVECVIELRRCIEDRTRTPARDGKLRVVLRTPGLSMQKGNICYVMGRIAERNGHADDAKAWYRDSLSVPHNDFTARSLSAQALRRLGEEWFP